VDFSGGPLSSDGGLLLLAALDREVGLTEAVAQALTDPRDPEHLTHSLLDLVRQRVYQLACGYEDANDAATLRRDPLFKTATGRAPTSGAALASQPTFCRFENAASRRDLWRLSRALLAFFVRQHQDERVVRITLDLDATEDPTHGQQEFNFYNHHYRSHCYLPLLAYATVTVADANGERQELPEQELLGALLRRVDRDGAYRTTAVLRRLVPVLRTAWPEVEIILRADSGFCRPDVLTWCEHHGVGYVLGFAKNAALVRRTEPWLADARQVFAAQPAPAPGALRPAVQVLGEFLYQTQSWEHERLVTCKAEVLAQGDNPRWLVSHGLPVDLQNPAARQQFYRARGDRENRIKELKNDLRADKTSCHRFSANQFRLLLTAVAYVLWQTLRKRLAGTEGARAQVGTLQLKLVKVAVRVQETQRRIYLQLASGYPWQRVWVTCATRVGGELRRT
jgi:hypothetical protein